jgi:hypothetical protein
MISYAWSERIWNVVYENWNFAAVWTIAPRPVHFPSRQPYRVRANLGNLLFRLLVPKSSPPTMSNLPDFLIWDLAQRELEILSLPSPPSYAVRRYDRQYLEIAGSHQNTKLIHYMWQEHPYLTDHQSATLVESLDHRKQGSILVILVTKTSLNGYRELVSVLDHQKWTMVTTSILESYGMSHPGILLKSKLDKVLSASRAWHRWWEVFKMHNVEVSISW